MFQWRLAVASQRSSGVRSGSGSGLALHGSRNAVDKVFKGTTLHP
jgi:hypothetical protein